MELRKVTDKSVLNDFHKLPSKIYEKDSNWIPHLRQDVEKVFDKNKNKSFQFGEIERWCLYQGTEVIGRIAAFTNSKYSSGMEQPTGGLGFFECIPDYSCAEILFNEAISWLKERNMEAVDGPINFGEKNMFWGLQIENFTDLSSYGINYNPEYYVEFFEKFGFEIYYNQLFYKRVLTEDLPKEVYVKAKAVMNDPDYDYYNAVGMSLDQIAGLFLKVYNNSWGGHHGFKKLKLDQVMSMMKSMKPVMDKRVIFFCYYKKEPIAFYVNLPELNDYFKYVQGNLNGLGKLKFLYHQKFNKSKTMVGIVFGVDRNFHGRGIESAISVWSREMILEETEFRETILTWIGDFNPKMVAVVEKLQTKKYRTLATYRYLFDRNKEFNRAPKAV